MGLKLFLKTWFLRKINLIESNYRTLNLILSVMLFLSSCRLLRLNPGTRGASNQPAFMGNCLTISHTCFPCLPSRWVSTCVLCPLIVGLNVCSVDIFLSIVSMVLVPWAVGTILGNGYGIQGKDYVALLQTSEITAGFHYRNWILDI